MLIGKTTPGNNTMLRTGTMMSASAGTGGVPVGPLPGLSSAPSRNCISATQRSRLLQRDQKAAVAVGPTHRVIAPAWHPHAPLEATLRELKPMDDCRAQLARKHARARHHQ